jgi:hypothetical protein
LGVAVILGGEKRDDLPKDGVWEIADAVHPRFYGFLRSGGGLPLLAALPGARSTTGVTAGGSLIFLALGPADSNFLAGVASSSRV